MQQMIDYEGRCSLLEISSCTNLKLIYTYIGEFCKYV
jgi:hypothetical protein